MVSVTLILCTAAIVFRTALRSRYWAWKIEHAAEPAEQVAALALLCNAGDGGRWGVTVLLEDARPEIRQCGVLALQYASPDWSRRRLVAALRDPDSDVRGLAALGLAMLHDDRVIPQLRAMYTSGTDQAAVGACLALQRLGSPAAQAVLAKLADTPGTPARRAALIEALGATGSTQAAKALLELLDDHRPCGAPTERERIMRKLGPLLAARGLASAPAPAPTSHSEQTIAERAAEALGRITGLVPRFASDQPPAQRTAAAQQWRAWIASHGN